jgi:hypothetical protein
VDALLEGVDREDGGLARRHGEQGGVVAGAEEEGRAVRGQAVAKAPDQAEFAGGRGLRPAVPRASAVSGRPAAPRFSGPAARLR